MEPAMAERITNPNSRIDLDAPTSRAVAKGIGEKLQQTLDPEQRFPDRLQKLLDKIRDSEAGAAKNNR
jgi:hypothetical protein